MERANAIMNLMLVLFAFGSLSFFLYGMHGMHKATRQASGKKNCWQYTVLDASHVVTHCGDTIKMDWKVPVK